MTHTWPMELFTPPIRDSLFLTAHKMDRLDRRSAVGILVVWVTAVWEDHPHTGCTHTGTETPNAKFKMGEVLGRKEAAMEQG